MSEIMRNGLLKYPLNSLLNNDCENYKLNRKNSLV